MRSIIADEFEDYMTKMGIDQLGGTGVAALRMTFFAGASAVMGAMLDPASIGAKGAKLDAIRLEILHYVAGLKEGARS